jgi:hypothetical protein
MLKSHTNTLLEKQQKYQNAYILTLVYKTTSNLTFGRLSPLKLRINQVSFNKLEKCSPGRNGLCSNQK